MTSCLVHPDEIIFGLTSMYKWKQAGFSLEEAGEWKEYNFIPEEAKQWKKAGFTREEALKWQRHFNNFFSANVWGNRSIQNAKKWHDAGFQNPQAAAEWQRHNFEPQEAVSWLRTGLSFYDAKRIKKSNLSLNKALLWWTTTSISPKDIDNWKSRGFTPKKAKPWVDAGVPFGLVKKWSSAGLSPAETKEWRQYKFNLTHAKKWKDQEFSAQEANEWWKAGFSNKLKKAKQWKDVGLSSREAHQAEIFKLDIQDVVMKGEEGIITAPPLWVALCKANKINLQKFKEKLTAESVDWCPGTGKPKDQSDIFLLSPYEIENKCYLFEAKSFQLLNKSTGLFRTTGKASPGETIFLDFGDGFAPIVDVIGIARGVDPLEYKAVLGNKSIVHSFKALWFLKIPPSLKKKMIKLGL